MAKAEFDFILAWELSEFGDLGHELEPLGGQRREMEFG